MAKCASCQKDAVWAWQPFGPGEDALVFTALGSHYRGFPVVKVCDECKQTAQKGRPGVLFNYKKSGYCVIDGVLREAPF